MPYPNGCCCLLQMASAFQSHQTQRFVALRPEIPLASKLPETDRGAFYMLKKCSITKVIIHSHFSMGNTGVSPVV